MPSLPRMSLALLAVLVAASVAGCAAAVPAPEPAGAATEPAGRWLLTWHRPVAAQTQALADFEAEASAIAGVPVRRLAAVSDRVVSVSLACPGAARCADAQARLRADPRVEALVPDARRRPSVP